MFLCLGLYLHAYYLGRTTRFLLFTRTRVVIIRIMSARWRPQGAPRCLLYIVQILKVLATVLL